jgi:Flp pilus assembly protein protease CpaA
MIETILTILTLIVLSIALISDVKTREIPDWLNYGFLFAAIGIKIIFSIELGWPLLIGASLGFLAAFIISAFFYYSHQWGGGDAKLLWGIGVVIGITYPFDNSSFTLLWFLISLLFLGSIWGLLWMAGLAFVHKKKFIKEFKQTLKNNRTSQITIWIISGLFLILSFFYTILWPLFLISLGLFYLFVFVTSTEKSCFIKEIPVKKLTEGDWLAKDVKINGKLIRKTLEKEDINKIKKHKLKSVLVKEGVPFVPGFFLAYLSIIFGEGLIVWVIRLLFT